MIKTKITLQDWHKEKIRSIYADDFKYWWDIRDQVVTGYNKQ